jgi:hypothetical protein
MVGLTENEEPIVSRLRELALQVSDEVREDIKWNALCFFKGNRAFVGIMPYKKYISVIFDRGVELEDPDTMLEGKGHTMRHIKIRCLNDLKGKNISSYIEQSFLLEEEEE